MPALEKKARTMDEMLAERQKGRTMDEMLAERQAPAGTVDPFGAFEAAPEPSFLQQAFRTIFPTKEPQMPVAYDLPEGRKYRTLPPTREEQPLIALKNIGEYYASRYITGRGLFLPDVATRFASESKSFSEALNKETGFVPTRKEEQIGSLLDFMGSIKTMGALVGPAVGKLPIRATAQRVIGGGLTFGARATTEQAAKKITEEEPMSPMGIAFETAIGMGFGLLEGAVARVKSEVAYKKFIKAHPEAKAYPKKLLFRANEAMSQWFRGLSRYVDKSGKVPAKHRDSVLKLANRIKRVYGKDLDTLFGRMHGYSQSETQLAIALKEKVGVSSETAEQAIDQIRKGVPVAEVDKALSLAKATGQIAVEPASEIIEKPPEAPFKAITAEKPPQVPSPAKPAGEAAIEKPEEIAKRLGVPIKIVPKGLRAKAQYRKSTDDIAIRSHLPKGFDRDAAIAHELGHRAHTKITAAQIKWHSEEMDAFNKLAKEFGKDINKLVGRNINYWEEKGDYHGYFESFAELYGRYIRGLSLPNNQFKMYFDKVTQLAAPSPAKPTAAPKISIDDAIKYYENKIAIEKRKETDRFYEGEIGRLKDKKKKGITEVVDPAYEPFAALLKPVPAEWGKLSQMTVEELMAEADKAYKANDLSRMEDLRFAANKLKMNKLRDTLDGLIFEMGLKKPPPSPAKPTIEKPLKEQIKEREAETATEITGISNRRRNRIIKETEKRIAESDIYQAELEGQEAKIGPGYYFVPETFRSEVEDIIGKRKGFPTKVQAMFTFDRYAKKIVDTPEGKAEIGPTPWDITVQEALGRGREGIDETAGEMDISDFVQQVKDSVEAKQIGELDKTALDRAAESGDPYLQYLVQKQDMLRDGQTVTEIDEMTKEWAEHYGLEESEIENEFLGAEPLKLKQIKTLPEDKQDAAIEALARENVLKQERQEAKQAVNEVFRANDIEVEVEEVAEIKPAKIQRDLLGKPVFTPATVGKTKELGIELGEVREADVPVKYELAQEVARQLNKPYAPTELKEVASAVMETKNWKQLFNNPSNPLPEIRTALRDAIEGQQIPFERRGKPVGAAIITPAGREIVQLAYGADSETGYHEAYHTLRRHLTPKYVKVLDKHFKGDQEAEAREFAEFAKTGKVKVGYLRAVWRKLVEKLKKIKSALQGRGYRTANDIFGEIQRGEIAKEAAAPGATQLETTGDRLIRESLRNARIKGEKARLKAAIKPKVSRARLNIKLHDYTPALPEMGQEPGGVVTPRKAGPRIKTKEGLTPALTKELEGAELPEGKFVEFRETEFGPAAAPSRRVSQREYEANRRQEARTKQVVQNIKQFSQSIGHSIEKRIDSISYRVLKIQPELKRQVRLREEAIALRINKDLKDREGFMKKSRKMSKDDWADFDYAAKSGDDVKLRELITKYDMAEDVAKVREILDGLYEGGLEVGMRIDYRKDLWPRRVKDLDGLLNAIIKEYGKSNILSPYQAAIERRKKQAGGRELTDEEKTQVLNSMMRGFGKRVWLATPGVTKRRSLWEMTPEFNKYYYNVRQSLDRYIYDMHDAIAAREFFGKTTERIQKLKTERSRLATRLNKLQTKTGYKQPMAEERYKEHISTARERFEKVTQELTELQDQSIQDSIGSYVFRLVSESHISPKNEARINQILEAYFQPKKMSRATRLFKTTAYLTTIGSHFQTLTQLKDYARILYRAPLEAPGATARAIIPGLKSRYTMEELGITATSVDIEGLSKVLDGTLTTTSFRRLDMKMKEIYADVVLTKYYKQARKARHLKKGSTFRERIEETMGRETAQTINDLRAGKKTALTRRLAFNEVLDMHPVARSELTEQYLRGGGTTKALYTLRTFGMKEFEYARKEILRGMKQHPKRNTGRLVWLAFTLGLAGAGVEALKDLMRGRKPRIAESVIDEWLRLVLMSRYTVHIMKKEGPGRGLLRSLLPPTKIADAPITDIMEGEVKESPRLLPIVGEPYYWWFGRGREKIEAKEGKSWSEATE